MDTRKKKFYFIPQVRELRTGAGFFEYAGNGAGVEAFVDPAMEGPAERYSIRVTPEGVRLIGASPQGLYRARTTFAQLLMNHPHKIPCLEINDEPDFPVRGFYHDVTRGRVPTLDTLKHLADTLAFYKINHLQLYIEHAFAFSKIPELWADKDPLTADDIRELDRYCGERHIDLVPSLSTFGHLYELLRLPRFEHLNELDIKASQIKRCLWDRMAHYTLDAVNPESFELVKGMIEEYAPLFTSRYFNICCDETFDLGKGKNAAAAGEGGLGTGQLYVDFVKKIMGVVRSAGKRPMLWGDVILKHPEYISELDGDDVIFLNWEYTPEVTSEPVRTFEAAGVRQYVCPGVNGWSRFAAEVDRACTNISKMIRFGKEAGAAGVLNTDWGDCGQVNLLASSYHGLAFGADMSWNVDGGDADDFDTRFAFLQWGIRDDDHNVGKLLRELGAISSYHFGNLYAWVNDKQCLWYKEDDVKAADPKELSTKMRRVRQIYGTLKEMGELRAKPIDNPEFQEYIWSAKATGWLLGLLLVKKKYEYGQDIGDIEIDIQKIINLGHEVLDQFKSLWRARNRESELCDVVETFESVIRRLSRMEAGRL